MHLVSWPTDSSNLSFPAVLSSILSLTKHFRGSDTCLRHSQRNMLSCTFQETAVYGEHIWFETNVSGDFCYVGEQNCMAKLLVSYMGLPAFTARVADAGFSATHPGDHKGCTAAAGGNVEGCQGRECVPPICVLKCCIFNFCRCWCSVCSGSLMQGCHSPRDYTMIFQGEAVGISHP